MNLQLYPPRSRAYLNRRTLLAGGACAPLAMPASAVQAGPSSRLSLGADVNENLTWLEPTLMAQTRTIWVRGFVPASEFLSGARSYNGDPGLAALRAAASSGHKVILSIKWDCTGAGQLGPVPAPGSAGEQAWFHVAGSLVHAMAGSLSILVVINELLIDTRPPDLQPGPDGRVPMIHFLRRLATFLSASHPKAAGGVPLPIYAGGFTRLDLPKTQNEAAVQNAITWINRDSQIAGADFHLHQPDLATSVQALDFIRGQMPSKPLIVSEFSLVWKWKRHLEDAIGASAAGAAFASQYGFSPQMTVRQFCNRAFAAPVSEGEWQGFLASQAWFEPDYLDAIAPMMQQQGVRTATYALTTNPQLGAVPTHIATGSTPWFLNNLLVPGLAYVPGGRRVAENDGFFASFLRWQMSV